MLALAPLAAPRGGLVGAAKAAGGMIVGTKLAYTVAAVGVAFGAGLLVRDMAVDDRPRGADAAEVAALSDRVQAVEASSRGGSARTDQRGASADGGRKVASLEARVEEQQARIDALEKSLAETTARAAAAETSATRASTGAAPRDASAETDRLKAMSDDDLLAYIKTLVSADRRGVAIDGRAVLDACEILLARPLDAGRRADGFIQKGIGYRVLKDRAAEEAAFKESLAIAGPRTAGGRSALYQLAWTAARNSDHRSAAEQFLALSQDTDAPVVQRAWNRLHAAGQFESAGDTARALAEYRSLTDEFGSSSDEGLRAVGDQAKASVSRLEKAAAGR